MKRVCFVLAFLPIAIGLMAQREAVSKPGAVRILKEVKPAILEIVPGSVEFIDATGNKAIDASETCKVVFKVANSGTGDGYGCVARLMGVGTTDGLAFSSTQNLSVIPVHGIQTVEFPIRANMNTVNGRVELTVQVDEPNGFGTDPITLAVNTRAFVAPRLQVMEYAITGTQSATLEKKKPFDLQVLLQNTQYGLAEDVYVSVSVPEGIMSLGETEYAFSKIEAGQTKSLEYSFIATNNYSGSTIPIQIHIREKHGKYAEDKTIDLGFNQTFASSKIQVDEIEQEQKEIVPASLTSEVDKNIPDNPKTNTNTFAFIIANENYQSQNFAQVPYALNDGSVFRNYCIQTLGIPEKSNVKFLTNATYAQMRQLILQLKNTAEVNPDSKIILYYAGHGAPSEGTQEAFLIPVDAFQVGDLCISLQSLYDELNDLQGNRITVFLDACFSGANRDNTMMAAARGVAIKPKKNVVQGNLVVFSAATGSETAWPYKEEGHGMFTYFLLKKLQETEGNVTYQELFDYLYSNVRRTSNNVNEKIQTPTVNSSIGLGDWWKEWKLR